MSTSAGSTPGTPPSRMPAPPYTFSRYLAPSCTAMRPATSPLGLPAGTSATRFSAVLISLGTPTIMHAPSYVLAPRLLVFAFAEPDHRLPRRIEEFRRDGGDLVFRQPGYRRQHLVEALIRLAVHRKARQTIHPCCRTLQREHQLSLRLLLRLGERVSAQPLGRPLAVLLPDLRRRQRRRYRLP